MEGNMSNTYVILKQQNTRDWWLVNLGGPKANGPVMSSSRWHARAWKTRGAAERYLNRYLSFIACGDDPSSLSVIELPDDVS